MPGYLETPLGANGRESFARGLEALVDSAEHPRRPLTTPALPDPLRMGAPRLRSDLSPASEELLGRIGAAIFLGGPPPVPKDWDDLTDQEKASFEANPVPSGAIERMAVEAAEWKREHYLARPGPSVGRPVVYGPRTFEEATVTPPGSGRNRPPLQGYCRLEGISRPLFHGEAFCPLRPVELDGTGDVICGSWCAWWTPGASPSDFGKCALLLAARSLEVLKDKRFFQDTP